MMTPYGIIGWERVNIHLYLYVEIYATTIQLQIAYLG